MKKYICSIVFLFLCAVTFAQVPELSFQSIAPEEGFSYPIIRGSVQDEEGFLWFGSFNVVYRYDGYKLKPYIFSDSKKSSISAYVNVIYRDSKNNFWVGTASGLKNLNRQTGEFTNYISDSTSHFFKNYIWSILEDSRNQLWIGAMGLFKFDSDNNELTGVPVPPELDILNKISIQSIAEDNSGILWLGTSIGILKYDVSNSKFIPVMIDPDINKLTAKNWNTGNYATPCIFKDEAGFLWAGTYGSGLIKIDPVSGKIETIPVTDSRTLTQCPIMSIAAENESELWLGTYRGLVLFDKNRGKIVIHSRYNENNNEGLSDEKIISIIKDKSGTLWAGTLNGGLNKVNRTTVPFKKIINKSWMSNVAITIVPLNDFFVSRSGSLFTGTGNGIEEITPGLDSIKTHPPYKGINVLIEDSKGNQWIALRQTSGGGMLIKNTKGDLLQVLDSAGQKFEKEIHYIYEASSGKYYFAADFYLYEVDPVTRKSRYLYQTPARIFIIREDTEGNLMIGTLLAGLHIYNPLTGMAEAVFTKNEDDSTSIIDNSLFSILKDTKNRIWITTGAGLCRYDPSRREFIKYNETPGAAYACLIEDNTGKLWLGSRNGVVSFNPETGQFKNYDQTYGLINNFHYASGKAGKFIFFKANSGISWFNPDDIKDNDFIPPVRITEFKVFDKIFPIYDDIELSHDENYISFEFAALSFISPERNQYAYKMDGVDKDWIYPSGRRYASYTSLKPGNYIFRVKASNNDGIWNDEGTVLNITIQPPWWQTVWAYAMYLIILTMIIYAWRRYDLKQQNLKYRLQIEHAFAEKQQEISQMKSRFFTNISHEFRTPLTLIIGPADKLVSIPDAPEVHKLGRVIKKNAMHLLRLINQLLDISRLDEGKLKLQVSYSDIVQFVKSIVMIFESLAESRNIKLVIAPEKEKIETYFDREKLENILINIISNAFKFIHEGGTITVCVGEKPDKVFIKIKDTGIGIPEKELTRLFDRFYQVDSSHTRERGGTGIGLALTKELVELHRGKISASSCEGEWSEFLIELPSGSQNYTSEEIIESLPEGIPGTGDAEIILPEIEKKSADNVKKTSDEREDKTIILIVEDNSDVRDYIIDSLGDDFDVIEASNGIEGVEIAREVIPDLIVSDIMMPRMDGYELTRTLKNDEKTNHIPVILLTAKSDQQSKFEGLETGADDYLIKPFDTTELRLRISNLINIRKILQQKYWGESGKPLRNEVFKLGDINEKFLSRVNDVLQKHMKEEAFSIEEFSSELAMSRTQLHRKIKAITGKSASRYLRSFRLAAAKNLIENEEGNISEIAYSVGFSSPIYFSKCFKDEFGFTPSELKSNSL